MADNTGRSPYEDIINLPHHVSPTRPRMSRADRAAQFSPFAALSGYGDAVQETARLTNRRIELNESAKAGWTKACGAGGGDRGIVRRQQFKPYFLQDRKIGRRRVISHRSQKRRMPVADRSFVMATGRIILPIADIIELVERQAVSRLFWDVRLIFSWRYQDTFYRYCAYGTEISGGRRVAVGGAAAAASIHRQAHWMLLWRRRFGVQARERAKRARGPVQWAGGVAAADLYGFLRGGEAVLGRHRGMGYASIRYGTLTIFTEQIAVWRPWIAHVQLLLTCVRIPSQALVFDISEYVPKPNGAAFLSSRCAQTQRQRCIQRG